MKSRRVRHLMFSATLVLGTGCGLNRFNETIQDTATIPGTVLMMATPLGYGGSFNNLDLSHSMGFQNAGVTPGNVDAIYVQSVHLQGAHPETDDFGAILSSVTMWVQAPSVPRATVASQNSFAAGSSSADLVLVMPSVNLKPFAVQPSMQVGADVVLKQKPALNTTITTTVILAVDIHL
jgi:hypothetical protein